MRVTSPLAPASAGAVPPVGGEELVKDLLDVALGDRQALTVERRGELPGAGLGAESGQAPELVGGEPGQVRLDLSALGRLRLVAVAVGPVERLRRLSCLRKLGRGPHGHLPV